MKINSVTINNFLAIGEAKLSLGDRGLVLVQGKNDDDESANSNGAGKSSLVDAISWCIYGITARGVSGDDVVNNKKANDCCVEVEIEDSGKVYLISRYRKHKKGKNGIFVFDITDEKDKRSLTGGTSKITQKKINSIVGCSQYVFNAAVYMGQENMPDLPGMTDTQLKFIVEESAGIERLRAALSVAKYKVNECERALDIINGEILSGERQIEHGLNKIKEEKEKAERFEKDIDEMALKKLAEESNIDAEIKKQLNAMKELPEESKIKGLLSDLADRLEKRKCEEKFLLSKIKDVESCKNMVLECRTKAEAIEFDTKLLRDEFEKIEKKVGTQCSECGKEYHTEDIKDARELLKEKLVLKLKQLKDSKTKLKDAKKLLKIVTEKQKNFSDSMTDISDVSSLQRKFLSDLDRIKAEKDKLNNLKNKKMNIASEIKAITEKKESNPHFAIIKSITKDIKKQNDSVKKAKLNRERAENDLELAKDAEDVFGKSGVRAHILDTVTPFLNEKTGEYLSALTDGNIQATWSTLTKTAKGELREKFGIIVSKKNGSNGFKGLSGGEKRKVRIATAMALQDLVAGRASKPISIFIADEIDDALDESGLERLMGILETKAKEKGTVLVISHNSLSDWIRQEIVVTNKGGISVVSGEV